jgi:glutathione S-transferase
LIEEKLERGYHALEVMNGHLSRQPFFAGDSYSIADIALYAYTHVAGEGSFDLGRFAALNAWLDRVSRQEGHVRITDAVGIEIEFPDA